MDNRGNPSIVFPLAETVTCAQEGEGFYESRFSDEQIEARVQQILPATIQDIETFADNYDAPEQVEGPLAPRVRSYESR